MPSQVELVISPRTSDLGGGLSVRRVLPFVKKRMVGPFIFLDHMGPVELAAQKEMKVRSHPHIGLSTLTYLFSGELLHRDSLGTEMMIKPGEVNWMTAGKGIAHSETAGNESESVKLEGLQFWVALPVDHEDVEPSFVHVDVLDLPKITVGRSVWTLAAGSAFGQSSPVPVYSPLFFLVTEAKVSDHFVMGLDAKTEGCVYITKGKILVGDETYGEGECVVFKRGTSIEFSLEAGTRVAVLGGMSFSEKRFIWWNFVSSSEKKIEDAKKRWKEEGFGEVIHETERIPLPES